MSERSARGFSVVYDAVRILYGMPTADVHAVMLRHYRMREEVCKASQAVIAQRADISTREVSRAIFKLKRDGWIMETAHRPGGRPNHYLVSEAMLVATATASREELLSVVRDPKERELSAERYDSESELIRLRVISDTTLSLNVTAERYDSESNKDTRETNKETKEETHRASNSKNQKSTDAELRAFVAKRAEKNARA